MKRITQGDLQNLYEPVPQQLADGVDSVLSSLPNRRENMVVKKKVSFSVVLAAVLLIAGMTALAVSQLNLFQNMAQMAEPIVPLEGAEALVETNLGSVENEYVKVTVEEAAYDGQGVMALVRLTPKDAEKYAMLNAFLQNTPEEIYDSSIVPVKAPEGSEEVEMDGKRIKLVNEGGVRALSVDGEPVEIPTDRETAMAEGLFVYEDGGELYYADMWEYQVTGRKDGREIIEYSVHLVQNGDEDAEAAGEEPMLSSGADAEEQPDGSVLVWMDFYSEEPMEDAIELTFRAETMVGGKKLPVEDLTFSLKKSVPEHRIALIPEDGKIGDRIEILSGEINFTRVRGYATVDYTYIPAENEPMGITLYFYDEAGNPITTGSGWAREMEAAGENLYRTQFEIQSFDEIPDEIIVEAKAIDGAVIGRCTCRAIKE